MSVKQEEGLVRTKLAMLHVVMLLGCPGKDTGLPTKPSVDGSAGMHMPDLGPAIECSADTECAAGLPATAPPGCAEAFCDHGSCAYRARDVDQDHHRDAHCESSDPMKPVAKGDDCDDSDPKVFPGETKQCSETESGTPIKYPGGKPQGACTYGTKLCQADGNFAACKGAVAPATADLCDGKDENCDGTPDSAPCMCENDKQQTCKGDECTPASTIVCTGGNWPSCPPSSKPANLGASCNSCGGVVQCNGACSTTQPGNLGAACNSCGGVVQCNGTCSTTQPGNLGAACNSCGGVIQCNGTCSTTQPGNLGAACNSCGGVIQCNGTCSTTQPWNYGAACNSCGGTIKCDGTCSTSQPWNYGSGCGQCGGTVLCDGSCSVATPSNLGAVQDVYTAQEKFACCWKDYKKTFGGPCDSGWNYAGTTITKVSGGGGCDIVSEGSGNDCSVTVRFHNNGLEGAICNIAVHEQRVCN
jgi:hypothetical protein